MKKVSLRTYVLLFSSILIFIACLIYSSTSSTKTKQFHFLSQNSDKLISPFFYNDNSFDQDNFNTSFNSRYNDDIIFQWNSYMNGEIPLDTLTYYLLDESANVKIRALHTDGVKSVDEPKIKSFYEFLYYAKEIEKSSVSSKYSWDYEKMHSKKVDKIIINEVVEKFENTKDVFLKNRYWFQIIKSLFYNHENLNLIDFYKKSSPGEPKNQLYYRAMCYVAGAYQKLNNSTNANYLYSVVYYQYPPMRQLALNNFHIENINDFYKILSLSKTKEEKSLLWYLYGLKADKVVALKEIHKLDPKSIFTDQLLPKIIAEEEERLVSSSKTNTLLGTTNRENYIDKEVLDLVSSIVREHKVTNTVDWNIALSYLYLLKNDIKSALSQIEISKNKISKSAANTNEIRSLYLLINAVDENKTMKWNLKKRNTEMDWLKTLVAGKSAESIKFKNLYFYIFNRIQLK